MQLCVIRSNGNKHGQSFVSRWSVFHQSERGPPYFNHCSNVTVAFPLVHGDTVFFEPALDLDTDHDVALNVRTAPKHNLFPSSVLKSHWTGRQRFASPNNDTYIDKQWSVE